MLQLAQGSCRLCGKPCETLWVRYAFLTLRSELPPLYPNTNAVAFVRL